MERKPWEIPVKYYQDDPMIEGVPSHNLPSRQVTPVPSVPSPEGTSKKRGRAKKSPPLETGTLSEPLPSPQDSSQAQPSLGTTSSDVYIGSCRVRADGGEVVAEIKKKRPPRTKPGPVQPGAWLGSGANLSKSIDQAPMNYRAGRHSREIDVDDVDEGPVFMPDEHRQRPLAAWEVPPEYNSPQEIGDGNEEATRSSHEG